MTSPSEGEQLAHDDAPAAHDKIVHQHAPQEPCTIDCIRQMERMSADTGIRYWMHNDGTVCQDWESCDTYEHTSPNGNEVIARIKAKTPAAEVYPYHEDGSSCTHRDQLKCPIRVHYSEFGLSQLGIQPRKRFNHEGPADMANVDKEPAPDQFCVACPHLWTSHAASSSDDGCSLCACTRYHDQLGQRHEQSPFEEAMSIVAEVIDGRVDVYGDPALVFTRHAQIWSGILGHEVQPWQVALCMMGYKLGRTAITPDYSDNSDDIEGYLDIFRTLLGEDMIVARDTAAYIAGGGKGVRT